MSSITREIEIEAETEFENKVSLRVITKTEAIARILKLYREAINNLNYKWVLDTIFYFAYRQIKKSLELTIELVMKNLNKSVNLQLVNSIHKEFD